MNIEKTDELTKEKVIDTLNEFFIKPIEISKKCNVCNDDLGDRLRSFIQENSKYFISHD